MVARVPKASLDRRLRAAATTFWFAVQRLARRRAEGPTTEPDEHKERRAIELRAAWKARQAELDEARGKSEVL